MQLKLLLVFFLYILKSDSGFAQSDYGYSDDLTKLTAWLSDIDSVIVRIGDKEKLKKISHQLSYLMEGIENIITGEKDLADLIPKRKEINDEDSVQLQLLVNQIAGDIDQLSDRMKKIKMNVSSTDQMIIEPIIHSFNEISQSRDTIKFDHLISYLYGQQYSQYGLKRSAKKSKEIGEKLLDMINEAKSKIKGNLTK